MRQRLHRRRMVVQQTGGHMTIERVLVIAILVILVVFLLLFLF